MAEFDGSSIGERIGVYRKLNRFTREELSDATGGRVGRDVIANIENGRRKDITVSQLLALADGLQVPHTALLFDITRPMSDSGISPWVVTSRSISQGVLAEETRNMTVSEALGWAGIRSIDSYENQLRAPQVVARQVGAWHRYQQALTLLKGITQHYEDASKAGEVADEIRWRFSTSILQAWEAYRRLEEMGVEVLDAPAVPESRAAEVSPEGVGLEDLYELQNIKVTRWGLHTLPRDRISREDWYVSDGLPRQLRDRFAELERDG